ncbi:MAG: hypothetical protein DRO09_04185 [Thermoprotei archaeon]|nr:MAG: hypothetical protein DRO09_04185 [Thermoprotei archaeon]
MKLYLVLSGEHRTLPLSEALAIARAEGVPLKVLVHLDQVLLVDAEPTYLKLLRVRASLIKYAGVLVDVIEVDRGGDAAKIVRAINHLSVRDIVFKRVKEYSPWLSYEDVVSYAKHSLRRSGSGGEVIDVILTEGVAVVGLRRFERDLSSFRARDPQNRPVYRPGTLTSVMSRVLVNLSRVSILRDSVFLDPFCGIGGLLLEACSIGVSSYLGIDINSDYVRGARENLTHYGCIPSVVSGDACSLPIAVGRVDAIGTDPPYGRMTRVSGRSSVKELMKSFLESAGKVLKKNSYMAFAQLKDALSSYEIEDLGFKVIEKHRNWVHGSLTRDIYVVVKS